VCLEIVSFARLTTSAAHVQTDPNDFVMNMAQNMHKYHERDYITAQYIQQLEYNEQVTSLTFERLSFNIVSR